MGLGAGLLGAMLLIGLGSVVSRRRRR